MEEGKEEKEKRKASASEVYINVLNKQIEFCENNPSKYPILYDKGFKDGLRKAIDIIITIKMEVNKNEETKTKINGH